MMNIRALMIEHAHPDSVTAPVGPRSTLIQRVTDFFRTESRWLINMSSWFFILISGGLMLWVATVMLLNPHEEIRLFSLELDGAIMGPWGLTYLGLGGLALALFQLSLVSTGALFTLIPSQRIRRAGHVALVGWSMLWFLNLLYFAIAGGDGAVLSAVVMGIFASSMTARAALDWTRPGLRPSDLVPSYRDRVDQLSDYAQNLFVVDDESKEEDRKRQEKDGVPWKRGVARVRQLPWTRWARQTGSTAKRGVVATGRLASRGWTRLRDGRTKKTDVAA